MSIQHDLVAAYAMHQAADRVLRDMLDTAVENGLTWGEIALAMGCSRQELRRLWDRSREVAA